MNRNLRDYERFVSAMFGAPCEYPFTDKRLAVANHTMYMLARTQSMFKWSGLPDTIPQRDLELLLQCRGFAGFYKVNGDLYAFYGGLGGEPNAYYMPTILTIANPALNLSVNATIDKDCVVIPNDSMYLGLLPMFNRYGTAMTEAEITGIMALINTRVAALVASDNDNTTKSAEKMFEDLKNGKLSIIANRQFFDGVTTQPYGATGNTNVLTNIIEMMQYIKASWYNEIGLNANYNMKRESINAGESQLNNDALLPLIDDMLRQRQEGAEKVNAMFGTNISVTLASSWQDNQEEIDAEQDAMENEDNGTAEGGEIGETETAETDV